VYLPAPPRLLTNPSDVSITACCTESDSLDARSPFVRQYRLLAGNLYRAKSVMQFVLDHLIWFDLIRGLDIHGSHCFNDSFCLICYGPQ
jgi:hypothetical protein